MRERHASRWKGRRCHSRPTCRCSAIRFFCLNPPYVYCTCACAAYACPVQHGGCRACRACMWLPQHAEPPPPKTSDGACVQSRAVLQHSSRLLYTKRHPPPDTPGVDTTCKKLMAARALSMRQNVHPERALCTAPRHSPRVYRGARPAAGRVHAMARNDANPPPLVKVRRRAPRIARTDISPISIATDARSFPARTSPPNCASDHGKVAVAAYERLRSRRHGWRVSVQSW